MYHQVFVLPTERWNAPTLTVPYLGTISRETHIASPVMCRSDQGRYLIENFFAKYCDEKGTLVATEAEATVGTTDTFATTAFQTNELPTVLVTDSSTEVPPAEPALTEPALTEPVLTESVPATTEEGQSDNSATNKSKKDPVKK
jgi:hypothetical protein